VKVALTERFQKDVRGLDPEQRNAAFEAILGLPRALGEPHLHAGLGLRKLHASGIFEARVGLGLRLVFTFDAGPVPNRVRLNVGGERREAQMAAEATTVLTLPLGDGVPYQGSRVWLVSISSETGFTPMFTGGGGDSRFLGVRATPEIVR
jgi:mRNA-degrading endonuclease RelE of RelBE toxin-antitoxin system